MGSLESAQAEAIASAALEVMNGWWDEQIFMEPLESGPGDYHRKVIGIIADRAAQILVDQQGAYANRVRIAAGMDINQNQSTGAVISTALQLGCLKCLEELQQALRDLTTNGGAYTISWPEPKLILQAKMNQAGGVPPSGEYQELLHDVFYRAEGLRNAAEALRYISLECPANCDPRLDYGSRIVKQLAETTGLSLYPSDHSSHSMQFLAEVDTFSMALRAIQTSLKRISDQMRRRRGPTTAEFKALLLKSNAKLEEVSFRLQVCDLIIALMAQIELQAAAVMLPILAYVLFETQNGLAEAARQLSAGLHDELTGGIIESRKYPVRHEHLLNHDYGTHLAR